MTDTWERAKARETLNKAIDEAGTDEFASAGYALGEELITQIESALIEQRERTIWECAERAQWVASQTQCDPHIVAREILALLPE